MLPSSGHVPCDRGKEAGQPYFSPMLRDLLVIETAGVLAGPAAGMFFAELGARVVKIENPSAGGDVTRRWKLPEEDPSSPVSAYFSSVNHGKEHLHLNLKSAEGRKDFDALLAKADVLISNHMAQDAEKLGLTRDRLRALNPTLIHGHIRGYADDAARPAYDVVLQAETGYLSMTGTDPEHLAKLPVAVIDILAAHQLKEGLLLALLHKARTGLGAYVEVSLEEAALTGLVNQATNWLMAGHVARPLGTLHPNIAPYGEVFRCADGEQLVLAVGSDVQFTKLCQILDLPDLTSDPRFITNADRVQHRNALAAELTPAMAAIPRPELLDSLLQAGVPAGAVNTIDQALFSPAAKRMTLEEVIEGVRTVRIRGNAFRSEHY